MTSRNPGQLVAVAALCALAGFFTAGCREQPGEMMTETGEGSSDQSDPDGDGSSSSGEPGGPAGGYELGGSAQGGAGNDGPTASEDCDPEAITLKAVVRDFKRGDQEGGHPDFETFGGMTPTLGLVEPELGADRKPVYTGLCSEPGMTESCPNDQQMTTRENFDQWYRGDGSEHPSFEVFLSLESDADTIRFESGEFFPLDGIGFGNEDRDHNFHFTTEVHTEFEYLGGEVFKFVGDDDVWIFINGQLTVDLGGLHGEATGVVELDAVAERLGLSVGNTYTFDLFHAERHTENSRFRIDTNLKFTKCGQLVPTGAP